MPKKVRKCICDWCGKGFNAVWGVGQAPHYCSDHCRKEARRSYNTAFQARRRKTLSEDKVDANRANARKNYAEKLWENWSNETDAILVLAKSDHPKEAITKYLCDNFRPRIKAQSAPDLSSLPVAKVADKVIVKSLGKNP